MIGRTILHYKISAKLGEGGMGEVYLATDTKLSRPVALKFLSSGVTSDATARQQLLLEAQAASRLNHPNIITVHALELTDEASFVVSEYVDGATLRAARAHLTELQLLIVFRQVCDALSEAHAKSIIHRDIKPENIMVDAKGRAKVMDFGLARDLRGPHGKSSTNAVAGTAYYMAPEQLLGEATDHRTDIFSLGAVMYEMLTGVRPFDGDYDMAVLYAIVNTDPPPLSEFNPSLPDELESLVRRCLEKSPNARWSDASEIAQRLDAVMAGWQTTTMAPTAQHVASVSTAQPEPLQDKLLGRDAEIDELIGGIRTVRQNTGVTILITGESGVGKTRLAEEVCRRLRTMGMTVLRARCLPHSGGLPYHAFATALQQVIPRWDTTLIAQLLERGNAAGTDLTHRLPVLQAFLEPTSTSRGLLNREQVWDAVLTLLRVIATERPVVISIDDLHWADKDTLDLFSYLGRNVAELPLALLGTLRESGVSETTAAPLDAILRQLRLDSGARFMELRRFSADETRQLVLSLLEADAIDADLVGLIVKRSAGNPLFVRELIAYLKTSDAIVQADGKWRLRRSEKSLPIPRHIQDLVTERIERLIPEDRAILEYASCETDYFDSHSLCACLGVERIALLKRLQELESRHGLIRHDRTRYRFDHPLIREILYESILPELRMEYHRQIADYLVHDIADTQDVSARIAHHLVASDQEEAAIPYLLTAADRARDVHANNEALRLYRQIETITDGNPDERGSALRLTSGLGDVLLALGSVVDSIGYFDRAVHLAEDSGDSIRTTELLTRLAVPLRINGQIDRAIDTAARAVTLARTANDPRRSAQGLNTLAFIHAAHGPYDQTITLSEESLALMARSPDPQIESIALSHLGHAHVHRGEFRRAVDVLERAITQQRSIGDTRGLAQSLNFAGLAYGRLGQFSRGLTAHFESLKTKRSLNDVSAVPGSLNGIGDTYRDLGMLTEATRYHTESLALAREQGNIGSQCDNLRDLGANDLLRGDLDSAERYLREVFKQATDNGYKWYVCRSLISLCDLAVARKDAHDADRLSGEAVDSARGIGAGELIVESLWVRAKNLRLHGRIDDAIASMHEAVETATRIDLHNLLWHLHHYTADLYAEHGLTDKARQANANARAELEQIIANLDDEDLKSRFTGLPDVQTVLRQA